MAFILNDRNEYYDILRSQTQSDMQSNQFKILSQNNEQILKDVEIFAETLPELPSEVAIGASILGVPPEYQAMKEIAQETATLRIHNEAKLWQELQETYQYEHLEDNMKMSIGDLLTAGLWPGGTKPGDVQYGVWAFAALDAFFQTFGPGGSGKWSIGSNAVNMLAPGQPMQVGRSSAYLRDLKAYDKLLQDGYTKVEAQNLLQVDLSATNVNNLGQDAFGIDAIKKQLDMISEAHTMGGEPVLANMWRNVVQGKPLNFDRGTKITLESVKAENTPYYHDLTTKYGMSGEEASKFIYDNIGEPIKQFDENGNIHYSSAFKPNKVNFYAGRRKQKYFWAGQTHQDYFRPDWADDNILLEYSPGKVTAAEFYEPGSRAFDLLSGTVDFAHQIVPELIAGKGVKGAKNLFRSLRGPNAAFDLMQSGRVRQTGKTIKISPRAMADEILEEVGSEIDPITGNGDFSKLFNKNAGSKNVDNIVVSRKNVRKGLRKIKRENTMFGRVPRFFQTTVDEVLNQKTNQLLFEALSDVGPEDLFYIATNPITRILPPQVQAAIIKEKNPLKIQKIFEEMIGTGYKITDEAGQLTPYTLPGQIIPKTGSLAFNKLLNKTGINQNAQYRTFGSWIGEKGLKTKRGIGSGIRKITPARLKRNPRNLIRVEETTDEIIDKMDSVAQYLEVDIPKELLGKTPAFERYLGFSSNFNATNDPWFRKMLGVVPNMGIPLNNLAVGYKQLASHLQINQYDVKEASKILDEFLQIDYMDKSAIRTFARVQGKRDVSRVKARGGNWETVAEAVDEMFEGQNKIKIYSTAKKRRILPNIGSNFKGYEINELGQPVDGVGRAVTSMTASLFTEMQDNIAPLVDYRLVEKAMGKMFKPYQKIGDGTYQKASFRYDTEQFLKYINPWDDAAINPFKDGAISIKRLEKSFFNNMASFYTRNVFKPLVLMRAAFFTRVFLEESARIAVRGLSGVFSKPHEYLIWLSAHNPNAKLGKLIEKIGGPKGAKYNKDAAQFLMEEEFLEATQKTLRFEDIAGGAGKQRRHNKNLEYLGKEASEMKIEAIAESVYHELRFLRNDPITQAVARYGYGSPELAEWITSATGRAARIALVKKGGKRWSGILDDSGSLLDQHLQFLESRIRITTGGVVNDGIDILKQADGSYKYNIRMDVDTGNQSIRKMIGNGELQKYGSTKTDDVVEFFSSEDKLVKGYSRRKVLDEIKQYYNKEDGIDPGTLSVLNPLSDTTDEKFLSQLEDGMEVFYSAIFDRLITKPIGYLNRSSVFKQYRWMFVGNRFQDFTPRLRKQFIDEAVSAAIPKSIVDELKGQSAIHKAGLIDDYEAMNIESKAFGLAGVKELLYDTRQRHTISDKIVNIFPFAEIWFEVFSTWGKLLNNNPYALRKGHVAIRGATGADALGPSSTDGFFAPDPADPQRDMFVYPFGGWMTNLIFDGEHTGQESRVKISPRGQVQGVNLLAQGFIPGPNPWVGFSINKLLPKIEHASTKAGAQYGWANDLEKFIYGDFAPPEKISEILWPASPVWTKLGAWLKDPDEFSVITENSSESEKMRATATIDLYRWGVSAGEPNRLYEANKLNSYLSRLYPGADPENISQGMIEDAYLEWAKEKSGTLFAFQFIYQQFGPTSFRPEYFIEDEEGGLYGRAVLYQEFSRIKEKNGEDDIATYNEFLQLYGIEYPYFMNPKSVAESGRKPVSIRVQNFQKENADIFDSLEVSGYYLNVDNPYEEQNWQDVIREKSLLSPDQYRRGVNSAVGFLRYKHFNKNLELMGLPNIQETLLKRLKREELKLALPGFQSDEYGMVKTPTAQDIFDEMQEHWTVNPSIKKLQAAQGFNEAYIYWQQAEELSMQYSPTYSKTWWLTSDDVRAKSLRIWMYNKANGIIENNPEFWPVWTGVMLKLYRDDNEYLEYIPER